jgi:hypothetical protein
MGNGARPVRLSPLVARNGCLGLKPKAKINNTLRSRPLADLRRRWAHCDNNGLLWNTLWPRGGMAAFSLCCEGLDVHATVRSPEGFSMWTAS